MGEYRGELSAGLPGRTGNERHGFAVKPGFADQKSGGDGNTNPAVFENVNREIRAAGGKFTVYVKIVVDTRESSFDRRRLGFAFRRIGFGPQSLVFVEADDYPAGTGRA
jgi:hypothetical protein